MKRGLLIVSLIALCAGSSQAAIQQGEFELGTLTTISNTDYQNGTNRDIFTMDLDFAYFVTDHLSMGVDFGGDWREISTTSSSSTKADQYHLGIKGKYHVQIQNQTVPYFGVLLGLAGQRTEATVGGSTTKTDDDGFYYGILGGARYELNRSNDLYLELQYKCYSGDIKDDYGLENELKLLIGILHQFN